MGTSRTHITLPEDVHADLDRFIAKQNRSHYIADAIRNALLITRQKAALREAGGAWKDKDHPELKAGAAAWVRKLRREAEARFKKQFRNR